MSCQSEVGAAIIRIISARRAVPENGIGLVSKYERPRLCFTKGGDAMARSTMDFAQQNTERAVQATNWLRAMAEQNLNQSKVAFEGFLTIARDAIRNVDQQASAIREHSLALAQQTLSNTFDFANKLVRMKDPQELPHIQSEYISRQAQLLGDQTRELGQKVMEGVHEIAKATQEGVAESSRRRSEAA